MDSLRQKRTFKAKNGHLRLKMDALIKNFNNLRLKMDVERLKKDILIKKLINLRQKFNSWGQNTNYFCVSFLQNFGTQPVSINSNLLKLSC